MTQSVRTDECEKVFNIGKKKCRRAAKKSASKIDFYIYKTDHYTGEYVITPTMSNVFPYELGMGWSSQSLVCF
jgi:hypothetical protein